MQHADAAYLAIYQITYIGLKEAGVVSVPSIPLLLMVLFYSQCNLDHFCYQALPTHICCGHTLRSNYHLQFIVAAAAIALTY